MLYCSIKVFIWLECCDKLIKIYCIQSQKIKVQKSKHLLRLMEETFWFQVHLHSLTPETMMLCHKWIFIVISIDISHGVSFLKLKTYIYRLHIFCTCMLVYECTFIFIYESVHWYVNINIQSSKATELKCFKQVFCKLIWITISS